MIVYCKTMTMTLPWMRNLSNVSNVDVRISLSAFGIFVVLALLVVYATTSRQAIAALSPYLQFAYNNFVKPHGCQTGEGQQSALESFYAAQVGPYCREKCTFQLSLSRLESTTRPASGFYADAKICLL